MFSVLTGGFAYTCAHLFMMEPSRKGRVRGGLLEKQILLVVLVEAMNLEKNKLCPLLALLKSSDTFGCPFYSSSIFIPLFFSSTFP